MAKGHKTGGRTKGTPNKTTLTKINELAQSGLTPLDYMIDVLRDPDADRTRRDEMAKAAAPYFHSKMPTAVVTPPPPKGPVDQNDESLLNAYISGLHDEADDS